MNHPDNQTPDTDGSLRLEIMSRLATGNIFPLLPTIETIAGYNRVNVGNPVSMRVDNVLIMSCAHALRDLESTEPERAHELTRGFRASLSHIDQIIFDVHVPSESDFLQRFGPK